MTSSAKKTLSLPRKSSRRTNDDDDRPARSGARLRRAQAQTRQRKIDPARKKHTSATPTGVPVTKVAPRATPAETPMRAEPRKEPRVTPNVERERPQRELFTLFAPCPLGLEEVLEKELKNLEFTHVERLRAGCRFQTDWQGILRANLYSRIATRILVQIAHAPVQTPDDIYALTLDTEWEKWFGPKERLRVDTSAVRSPMQSLQYCNLRVKDAICDRLRQREGSRPDVDTVRPDAKVHLFLDEHTATLYLDSSGESLFKRGWRHDKGQAPLRENLAAGLLALSGWEPQQPLLDPFCGSGTILIEAAWIALNAPAGLSRPFHFERLRNHNPRIWRTLKEKARDEIRPTLDTELIGSDIDTQAIAQAQENLRRARLAPDNIRFETQNALALMPPSTPGVIVTNPPYGERLSGEDSDFWYQWSTHLKTHYDAWSVNVISSDLELPLHLKLRPDRRFPVYNGALDCRLFQFQIHGLKE